MKQLATISEVEGYRKWLENPSNDSKTELTNHLVQMRPSVSLSLDRISNWNGVLAEVMLLENDMKGWNVLNTSYEYLKASRRLRLSFLDARIGQKSGFLSEFTLLLAHAIAVHDDDFAVILGDRLVKAINEADKRIVFSSDDSLHLYIIELYSRWRNLFIINEKFRPQAPLYSRLFSEVANSAEISKVMIELCDYHLERNEANDDITEFWKAPYRYFPVELLAYDRIRMLDGFPSCLQGHELLSSIFASPPKYVAQPRDEILEQIIAKAQEIKLI